MLSRTGTYALQATLLLARRGGDNNVTANTMANELRIPRTYLAKVLQRLAQEGLLESARGAGGGYRLTVPPDRLTVATVVAPFQRLRPTRDCLLGGRCDPLNPCSAHRAREGWTAEVLRVLERTTLSDLLTQDFSGRTSECRADAEVSS